MLLEETAVGGPLAQLLVLSGPLGCLRSPEPVLGVEAEDGVPMGLVTAALPIAASAGSSSPNRSECLLLLLVDPTAVADDPLAGVELVVVALI